MNEGRSKNQEMNREDRRKGDNHYMAEPPPTGTDVSPGYLAYSIRPIHKNVLNGIDPPVQLASYVGIVMYQYSYHA